MHYYLIALCTLIPQVAASMLSRVNVSFDNITCYQSPSCIDRFWLLVYLLFADWCICWWFYEVDNTRVQ